MGSPRVHERFDVHCMGCGRSYERRKKPNYCTFKGCQSENIVVEENSKYVLETIFPGKDNSYYHDKRGMVDDGPTFSLGLANDYAY